VGIVSHLSYVIDLGERTMNSVSSSDFSLHA